MAGRLLYLFILALHKPCCVTAGGVGTIEEELADQPAYLSEFH